MLREEILNFCRTEKKIICYGRGDYAQRIYLFLKVYGIEVDSFCISDTQEKVTPYFLGKPVYYLSEVAKLKEEYIIFISVHERLHVDIEKLLLALQITNYKKITSDMVYGMAVIGAKYQAKIGEISNQILLDNVRINLSNRVHDFSHEKDYEERARKIKQCFSMVEIRYIHKFLGWTSGELIYYKEVYKNENNKFILLYVDDPRTAGASDFSIPNSVLLKKFKGDYFEALTQENADFWHWFLLKNAEFIKADGTDYSKKVILPTIIARARDNLFWSHNKRYIDFSQEEEKKGKDKLLEWGINRKYACFFSRDSQYCNELKYNYNTEYMAKYRNSNIDNFYKMTDDFHRLGMQSVRMGSVVEKPFIRDGVIDYGSECNSNFMDIYLSSRCEFFIGDSSGINALPVLFSRPLIIINVPNVLIPRDMPVACSQERDLQIFQKYWDTKKQRYLTLKEMFEFENEWNFDEAAHVGNKVFKKYDNAGLIPIKNTPDEILDVAKEMYMRLNGLMRYDKEDERLQGKFQEFMYNALEKNKNSCGFNARLGLTFLKNNKWFLD